jgi:predicted metal-dependent hydrolase
MQVRKVMLDFTDAKVHWSPGNPEYSQVLNAVSTGLPPIEQFLVKVVRKAKAELPAYRPELAADVAMFVGQEGRHARLHAQFNKLLAQAGYHDVEALEARFRADLDRFFETRSLRWCLAYCEGFETFGPIVSAFFFDRGARYMADWDEPTVYLWLWHFAEEYEHRTVCNYLFEELYGSYPARLWGIACLVAHAVRHVTIVARHLIRTDRRSGRIARGPRSTLRLVRALLSLAAYGVPRLGRALLPGYDPARLPEPPRSTALLGEASTRYGVLDVA